MLRDQGARIEVDGGPGPGLEKRGLTPESEGRWMGGISVTQLDITILPSASPPCPEEPPTKPQGPKRVGSLTAPPQLGAMYASRP